LAEIFFDLLVERPDLVMTFTAKPNVYGGIACRVLRIPHILTITGLGRSLSATRTFGGRLHKSLLSAAVGPLMRLGCQNTEDLQFINSLVPQTKEIGFVVNGSGFNPKKTGFRPRAPHEPDRTVNDSLRILVISRMLKSKGIDFVVEFVNLCASKFLPYQFTVVGHYDSQDANSISEEEMEALKSSPNVEYFSFTKLVDAFYEKCDCVLIASDREGCPRVALEAMAYRKLVIGSSVPGITGLIRDNVNGILFHHRNTESLLSSLEKVRSMNAATWYLITDYAKNETLREYSAEHVAQTYVTEINRFSTT